MRRRWIFVGLALLGAGLAGVSEEDAPHKACTAGLGPFGSLTGNAAHNCGVHNILFLGAIVAAIFGLMLMVVALLIRS